MSVNVPPYFPVCNGHYSLMGLLNLVQALRLVAMQNMSWCSGMSRHVVHMWGGHCKRSGRHVPRLPSGVCKGICGGPCQ